MNRGIGVLVILGGACLILLGFLIYSGGLNWFGRLPGDIRYEGETTRFYFPVVSLILISLAINLILFLIRKLFVG